MVAAGVQTNGITVGPRRLTKSFSEVGGERLADRDTQNDITASVERYFVIILFYSFIITDVSNTSQNMEFKYTYMNYF